MLKPFSPNMLKTYQTCPRKFYMRYILNINVPLSVTAFEKGKKIHALASYFLKNINISRIETALCADERIVWNKLINNEFFKKEALHCEYQISCKLGQYWLGGRLDAVVCDGGDYYILDYKTGALPKNPQYDYQTMVYLLALDKLLNEYSFLSFVYIDLKNDKNHIIEFSDSLKTEYEQKLTYICEQINNDSVYCSNIENCKNCEYFNLCEK